MSANNNNNNNIGSGSSSISGNTSSKCNNFKPHQLKPDKCKNCFGEQSKHHQQQNPEVTGNIESKPKQQEQQEQQDEPTETDVSGSRSNQDHETKDKLIERYEKEIAKLKSDLSIAQQDASNTCQQCQSYRGQLDSCKAQCQSLERERNQLKEELKAMEREMEEMHDTFKEEESEQFEQTKQELDLAMKNCKILQIRLHKAERQYGQLEQVKTMLERQLMESNSRVQSDNPQQQQQQQQSINFTQIGSDSVKLSTCEYDKLLKDLSDTFEREKDLQEQMKYSQEEAQLKSDRLQSVEAENEILLSKVSKLTLANSRLRARASSPIQQQVSGEADLGATMTVSDIREATESKSELIQESEQLKLALEFAQSECDRLKSKLQESQSKLDSLNKALQASESRCSELDSELERMKKRRQASFEAGAQAEDPKLADQVSSLELECRQLRSKLVQSERENRQLKAQSSLPSSGQSAGRQSVRGELVPMRGVPKWNSIDMTSGPAQAPSNGGEQARYRELNRQLQEQCDSLRGQNESLERRLEELTASSCGSPTGGQSNMESDLLEKLKRRLEFSENELAKVRSRLVEMDLECSRVQRQHKRLVESLESSSSDASGMIMNRRRLKLPPESVRDSMSRQELRQAVRELEQEVEECFALLRAKDCLITERASEANSQSQRESSTSVSTSEEQVKSLRRLLEQERLLSNNLKIDVNCLEENKQELMSNTMMLERERVAMEEELDKLRSVNMELNTDLEDLKMDQRNQSNRLKDLQASFDKVRADLLKAQEQLQQQVRHTRESSKSPSSGDSNDMLLMARDLSELKVKNGFLMRQLEIAREENSRQLEDLRQTQDIQQRRAVEMAQIELREAHLAETQQLRDELNELKQKLTTSQRQLARQEEEAAGERDKLRSMERDWRRERGQLQQKADQVEAQLSLERRSNEFRVKEIESVVRDKERELISLQDKCVQLERDLKRLQGKHKLLMESSESRQQTLAKELNCKKRELSDLIATRHAREEEYLEHCRRFTSEKSTLTEALESLKRSYDEKLAELRSSRELLALRQEQAYKERVAAQERLDELGAQVLSMSEHRTQVRLLEQQLQTYERQMESLRRDCLSMKEDKIRLKSRCDELEARCVHYEKQELIAKTSSISPISSSANLFLRARSNLTGSNRATGVPAAHNNLERSPKTRDNKDDDNNHMIERLTSKINDQRHLINMLKEQYDSAQVELRQMKLFQSAEKQKWQSLASQLQSRLNESEEKLLFETSVAANQVTFDNCRRKFEIKWAEERKSSREIISQQQAQNELLMKDLKRINQQHDLLRLHSKQLEANNQKLSKKLIEYQNQQQRPRAELNAIDGRSAERKLSECLADRRQLIARQSELGQVNESLLALLRDQVRPLVATVTKIMTAMEATSSDAKRPGQEEFGKRLSSSGFSSRNESADEGSKSTLRPLMTSSAQRPQSSAGRGEGAHEANISTAQQQQQQQQVQQQGSRLARIFGGSPKGKSLAPLAVEEKSQQVRAQAPSSPSKSTKKVRIKSAALGITPSEKRQLKERLGELSKAVDELSSGKLGHLRLPSSTGERELPDRLAPRLAFDASQADEADSSSTTAPGRVHWQLDADGSDLDSERSWSVQSEARPSSSNQYKRFPQTSPSSRQSQRRQQKASLTDYESESSLAGSELSLSLSQPAGGRPISGVESDSCVAPSSRLKSSGSRRRGLKMRFADTLRNISRSITGLASDSESESTASPAQRSGGPKGKDAKASSSPSASRTGAVARMAQRQEGQSLKEIRV